MDEKVKQSLEKHVAGAIVARKTPFDDLITPSNQEALDRDFNVKFTVPFYMNLGGYGYERNRLYEQLSAILPDITSEVVAKLLGDANWRSRSVGAFYAALLNMTGFQEQIGSLLLKSEVCYAGTSYCRTLAEFNDQRSIDYLNQYLDYYLTKKDLWFDQGDAMGALAHLDKQNESNELSKHLEKWAEFVSNKSQWDLDSSITLFEEKMIDMKEMKTAIQENC